MPSVTPGGLHLWFGPDRYRKRQRVHADLASLHIDSLDYHEHRGPELSAETLALVIREHPANSPIRFVLVEEAHRLHASCISWLEAHHQVFRETARLVLSTDLPPESAASLAPLSPHGHTELFGWLSAPDLGRWVAAYLGAAGKRIAPAALAELTRACGADLAACQAWLDQLIAWIGPRAEIAAEDVGQFLPRDEAIRQRESTGRPEPPSRAAFALTDAIVRREAPAALKAVHEQLAAGKDVLELLGLIAWQLQRWLAVGRLARSGLSASGIAAALKLQGWQVERTITELRSRRLKSVHAWLESCWQIDTMIKSGRTIPRLALEGLVLAMCRD